MSQHAMVNTLQYRMSYTWQETMKALDFYTIMTMTMEDDEGAKNKEHAVDRISESEMKTSSKKTTNKKVNKFNVYIIC